MGADLRQAGYMYGTCPVVLSNHTGQRNCRCHRPYCFYQITAKLDVAGFHINEVFPGTPIAEVLHSGTAFVDWEISMAQ